MLYEGLIKINPVTREFKLLRWKTVSAVEADSSDFSIEISISLDKDMENILLQAFPRDKLGQVKTIIDANMKLSSEGFYYQLYLSTASSNEYNVIIYHKPEDNYTEVISYEQVNFQKHISKGELNNLAEEELTFTAGNS